MFNGLPDVPDYCEGDGCGVLSPVIWWQKDNHAWLCLLCWASVTADHERAMVV